MFLPEKLTHLLEVSAPPPDVHKPYTLAHLIGWLESQDPEARYNWTDCFNCLFGQYARANGSVAVDKSPWSHALWKMREIYDVFNADGMMISIGRQQPWTFGAALERARALTGWVA